MNTAEASIVRVRRAAAIGLVLLAVAAGCASPSAPDAQANDPESATLPPGCDPARPALAHQSGSLVPRSPNDPAILPCIVRAGTGTGEPTLGILSTGAIVLFPVSSTMGTFELAYSKDEGATWSTLTPSLRAGPAQVASHRVNVDPFLYVDPATDRIFAELLAGTCGELAISDDAGATWTHATAGCAEADHVSIFAGPPATSALGGYPNVVHRCAANGGVAYYTTLTTCQRSLDGGMTWQPPGDAAFEPDPSRSGHQDIPGFCDGLHGHAVADARGWIYLPKGWCGRPWLATSRDEGATWTRHQVSELPMARDNCGFDEHDAAVGVDREGTIYYAWLAKDRLPRLATSMDGGATWSEPQIVAPPDLVEARHIELAASDEPGRLALVYVGSTNAPGPPFQDSPTLAERAPCLYPDFAEPVGYEDTTWHGYMSISFDANAEAPTFWTAAVNDPTAPLIKGPCKLTTCGPMADFIDVRIGPDGTPWASLAAGGSGANAGPSQALVGRLWDGASLWGPADLNGPYP